MTIYRLTLACLCTIVVYKVISYIRSRTAKQKRGCRPLPHFWHREPFFGIDTTIGTIVDVIRNQNLLRLEERFKVYGSTYQTTSVGIGTIWSRDPELIQCVWGTNDKDWGNEPYRLEPMEPFCGSGFITKDDVVWEHSRALMRPSSHKSRISNLSFFEAATEAMIRKIPRDGSTVDLQPLLLKMVGALHVSWYAKQHY